jgi:hypothetical protein
MNAIYIKWSILLFFSTIRVHGKSCLSVLSGVRYGPEEVISNLTQPDIYDFSKRPSLAYDDVTKSIKDKPDAVYISVDVGTIVRINQIQQTLISRCEQLFFYPPLFFFSLFLSLKVSLNAHILMLLKKPLFLCLSFQHS